MVNRFKRYMEITNRLIETNPALCLKKNADESADCLLRLTAHAEQLWKDAKSLYFEQSYASALFLSIVCMEETGKIYVSRLQIQARELFGNVFLTSPHTSVKRKNNPFYSHRDKHLLAAGAGALVNSRLDRTIGIDKVIQFLDDVERGEIERLRQSCIYIDHDGSQPVFPIDQITEPKAKLYLILSGEILAESLGHTSEHWERLLNQVGEFECAVGAIA